MQANSIDWTPTNKDMLLKSEVGKHLICEVKDRSARLHIYNFDLSSTDMVDRDWNKTFTISRFLKEKGFYICKIVNFVVDKTGKLNCVVLPVFYLGTDINRDYKAWEYMITLDCFSSAYNPVRCNLNSIQRNSSKPLCNESQQVESFDTFENSLAKVAATLE